MNDDLEQELRALQPAAPPPTLLRRLRANPPPVRSPWWQRVIAVYAGQERPWPKLTAGAAVMVVAALVLHQPRSTDDAPASQPRAFSTPSRDQRPITTTPAAFQTGNPAVVGHSPPPASEILRGALLDSAVPRVNLGNDYAALDSSLLFSPANRFDLDAPAGPIRLNCGALRAVNDGPDHVFERLSLPFRSRF